MIPMSTNKLGESVWVTLFALLILMIPVHTSAFQTDFEHDPRWNCQPVTIEETSLLRVLTLDECQYASERDMIYIYDRARQIQMDNWLETLNFEDSIWAFDAGGNGQIDLAIDFYRDNEALIAELYDRRDAHRLEIIHDANGVSVSKTRWTVRVTAPDGWWQHDDILNFNLSLKVNGPVRAIFDAPPYLSNLTTNDVIDFEVLIRDLDQNGIPDYQLIQAYSVPANADLTRTFLIVNGDGHEWPITNALFWPYLSTEVTDWVKDYLESPPPIQIDWEQSSIASIGQFTASHSGDNNWYIQSVAPFGRGDSLYANFENPYAFYDLANDQDGYPELVVRFESYAANDPVFLRGRFNQPIMWVRYSWNQRNIPDAVWDFNVNLLGRNPIETLVELPDVSVFTIPYEDIPGWVLENTWDTAMFVAVEGVNYRSSEGIYEWGPSNSLRTGYVTGYDDQPPFADYSHISPGMRGEYSFHYLDSPYLYFSPIDNKLHLLGAEWGLWNMGDEQYIEYRNLNGDGYINQWLYLDEDTIMQQLIAADGYLIYARENVVTLRQVNIPDAHFELQPPASHDDWLILQEQLDRHQANLDPTDFAALLAQFDGPGLEITEATLRDFRQTEAGFRFVLELSEGVQRSGQFTLNGDFPEEAGAYLLEGSDNALSILPLTPAHIFIPEDGIHLPHEIISLHPAAISLTIENRGLEDANNLDIELFVEQGQDRHSIGQTTTDVFSMASTTTTILWEPMEVGEWILSVRIGTNTQRLTDVIVSPATVSQRELITLWGEQPADGVLIIMLLLLLAVVALTIFLLFARNLSLRQIQED